LGFKPRGVVIIPTLGRASIKRVIGEIVADSIGQEIRIIVVADGSQALEKIRAMSLEPLRVEILLNQGIQGISGSFNTGLSRVQDGEFIFLFSDDDHWKIGKFDNLFTAITQYTTDKTIVISQVLKNKGGKNAFPKFGTDPIRCMMTFSYGHRVFIRNSHYVSLTAAILPSEARLIKFREEYKLREDLMWLQDLIGSGFEVSRCECVTGEVVMNYRHTVDREDAHQTRQFLTYLESISPKLKETFLYYHLLRPYAVCGDRDGFKSTYKMFVASEKNKSFRNRASIWFLQLVNYLLSKKRSEPV
jgi:glycosyltransferase involved in cell wall biosynthesis